MLIDLKPACRQMIDLLVAVTDDQLTNSTPCTEYTLDDLIEHVDEAARAFTTVAGADGGPSTHDTETTGPGRWRDRVATHVRSLGEAWDDPTAWQGSSEAAGLNLPNERWGKIALTEMVVHGWDIAQSTGLPLDLPEDTLESCLDHVTEFVSSAPLPDLWGPPQPVSPDAALIDRIVAATGRVPRPLAR